MPHCGGIAVLCRIKTYSSHIARLHLPYRSAAQQQQKGIGAMTRQALFVFAIAAVALCGCAGARNDGNASSGSQRSIDADIAATHDEGPTLDNQDVDQVSVEPRVTVPLGREY
jgi:hypothetical protein